MVNGYQVLKNWTNGPPHFVAVKDGKPHNISVDLSAATRTFDDRGLLRASQFSLTPVNVGTAALIGEAVLSTT
jgi:hypothetical protein